MNKIATIVSVVFYAALFSFIPSSSANASGYWNWNCQHSSLTSFWEEDIAGTELRGRGTLCTTSNGMWSTLKVRGMTPGNAYTVWWVYIDDPESCADFPLPVPDAIPFPEPPQYAGKCGLADFFTQDVSGEFLNPLAVYGRMDSGVSRHARRTRFAGDLRSFEPSHGSQVWMFVFGHGPADDTDNRQLARQLLTPEDPLSGVPHLGIEGRPFGYPAGVVVFEIP